MSLLANTNKFLSLSLSDRHEKLLIISLLGIFFILLLINALGQSIDQYGADGQTYLKLGEQISLSNNFIACDNFYHSYWSPGWVMVIGTLFKVFGKTYIIVRIFLICCVILSAYMVYRMSKDNCGMMPAFIVTLLFMASTLIFRYTVYFQYEVFLGFLITIMTYIFVKKFKQENKVKNILYSLLAGFVTAYACLTSGKMIILALIYLIFLSIYYRKSFLIRSLPAILTVILVISSWSYRNYNCFNEFILLTSNGGINLYIGNNSHSTLTYSLPEKELRPDYRFYESARWQSLAVNYMIDNPGTTLKRMVQKMLLFFNPHYGDQIVITILFVIALVRFFRNRKDLKITDLWIICLPFVFWTVHIVFFYAPRFIIPVWPMMALLAASSMKRWKE